MDQRRMGVWLAVALAVGIAALGLLDFLRGPPSEAAALHTLAAARPATPAGPDALRTAPAESRSGEPEAGEPATPRAQPFLTRPLTELPSVRPRVHAPGARLPAAGRFLIASRKLSGPFFAETVILLLDYSGAGALGLVINRPTPTLLSDLLPEVARLSQRRDRVHIGGPVDPRMMTFLIRSEVTIPESVAVTKDVYATTNPAALRTIIQSAAPPSQFHVFVGYAGWGPGQLDSELSRGDWHVGDAEADAIFDDAPADLWQRIVVEFEGIQVRRSGRPAALALR